MTVTYTYKGRQEQTFGAHEMVRRSILEKAGWALAKEPETYQTELPSDIPGYDDLRMAGLRTIEDVQDIDDLTDIDGIGAVTAERIHTYLETL